MYVYLRTSMEAIENQLLREVTEKLKRETGTACGKIQIRASYSTTELHSLSFQMVS